MSGDWRAHRPSAIVSGRREGILQGILGEIKVAQQADERGEDPARLGTIDLVQHLAQFFGCVLASHSYA